MRQFGPFDSKAKKRGALGACVLALIVAGGVGLYSLPVSTWSGSARQAAPMNSSDPSMAQVQAAFGHDIPVQAAPAPASVPNGPLHVPNVPMSQLEPPGYGTQPPAAPPVQAVPAPAQAAPAPPDNRDVLRAQARGAYLQGCNAFTESRRIRTERMTTGQSMNDPTYISYLSGQWVTVANASVRLNALAPQCSPDDGAAVSAAARTLDGFADTLHGEWKAADPSPTGPL